MSDPTDVKALIAEARAAANFGVPDFTHSNLIDSLATALTDAEAQGFARGVEEAARVADAHAALSKDLRDHYKGAGQADVAHVWECACTQIKALANDVRRLSNEQKS